MSYEPLFTKPEPDWSTAQARQTIVPSEIHGRSDFRMQPRPMGPGTWYGAVPAPTSTDDTIKTILIIAAIGLVAYFLFKGAKKKNPGRRRTRMNPPGVRGRNSAGKRRGARRNPARGRARDALGRFI